MPEIINLKSIKIKIYSTVLEDGLLEIMLGIYLVLSGIYLNNKSMILNYLWLPIALVLIEVIRRRYVFPRSGYVKISHSVIEIVTVLVVILIGAVIMTALIGLIATSMGFSFDGNWRGILSYALIFLTTFSICFIGYRFRAPRWYMYGISIGGIFLLSKAFDVPELVLGLGIWITLVGMLVFVRFLKQFPIKPNQSTDNGSQANEEKMLEVSNAS